MGSNFNGPETDLGIVVRDPLEPAEVAAPFAEAIVNPAFLQSEFPPHHQAHRVDAGVHEFRRPP